ncbi:cytokinesis protein sepH [Histomonas meleagridis]|uniref:cytokinesis protein sepH n=1 Tax=Histomonas meleagridis TaxID=135588 RepID=UPI003559AC37|nr:cytokinesis protein sepH [Histomonas meleagridis]KAH0804817.1 cytokinesis protein sepH [Histomonas meleagridis]
MKSVNEYTFEQTITPGDHPQVFQAMSSRTGTLVAIKFFPPKIIESIEKAAISRLFAMFSSMRHRNIVHYHEVIYNTTGVFIVMDWCEGNSLRTTIDRFKSIPEKLVARYVWDILQGLEYLHEQGNTHNNLRASNILLQNGVPKITDFGLSATITNLNIQDNPYWSAPEVLNSKTFTKESDIWSLGCTIIELMTGKPPFKDLPPEEARMRILSESPPLPTNASTHLCDFLTMCFKRDPSERPSAKQLQSYLWLYNEKEAAAKRESEQQKGEQLQINHNRGNASLGPDFNALDKFDIDSDSDDFIPPQPPRKNNAPLLQLTPTKTKKQKENSSSDMFGSSSDKPKIAPNKNKPLLKLPGNDSSSDNVFGSDSDDKPLALPQNNKNKPLLQINNPPNNKNKPLLKLPGNDSSSDNVFGSDSDDKPLALPQNNKNKPLLQINNPPNNKNQPLLKLPGNDSSSDNVFGSDSDDKPLALPQNNKNKPLIQLNNVNSSSDVFGSDSDDRPLTLHKKQMVNPNSALKSVTSTEKNALALFAEDDSESGFDVTSGEDSSGTESLTIQSFVRDQGDLGFIDDEDPEEQKIFAQRSRVEELTRELISNLHLLKLGIPSHTLLGYLERILSILKEEPSVRSTLISQQGVMPVIEILEFSKVNDVEISRSLLSIIFEMCVGQSQIKENFCLLGGIPPVMKFLDPSIDFTCRQSAVNILTEICSKSQDNTQMFIACNGVSALVKILHYNVESEKQMISIALQTTMDIFSSQRATQQADFCRLFMKAGVLPPLASILYELAELQNRSQEVNKMIENICDLDLIFSQADTKVKIAMSEPDVMEKIVESLYSKAERSARQVLAPQNILQLCKTVKFIGMDPETRDNLTSSGVMEMTCELLKVDFGNSASSKTDTLHIHSNLITLLAEMCKLSRARICFVAESRLLKYLCEYLQTESEIKSQTLSVIMEMYLVADVNQESMMKLIEDNLIGIYLDNLPQPYWCTKAITAIYSLLMKEEYHIEKMIVKEEAIKKFRKGLKLVNQDNAPTFIGKLIGICQQSVEFLSNLLNKEFIGIIIEKFKMTSQVPVSLLELVLVMFQSNVDNVKILRENKLKLIVQSFSQCDNIKQKRLAQQITKFFE